MPTGNERAERERQMILDAKARGTGAKFRTYAKLSGPGWLQSAITLGGGSLAGSLYLGIIGGYSMLWLQVVAMAMGVIMLSAIAYVTLATGKRPFPAINDHVNPVLGWGWAFATFMANIVWCLPQFSLANAAVQQNLMPDLQGTQASIGICSVILVISIIITWSYDSGGWGVKLYEGLLRVVVAAIVLSFFGVVVKMSVAGGLPWTEILAGLVPDFSLLFEPASTFDAALASAGEHAGYWKDKIITMQRDVMITAAATAVGINMTFLLPYSILARGWDSDFRGLAIFDLSTGMLIPFVTATGCVVIASASQFHAIPGPGLLGERDAQGRIVEPAPNLVGQYRDSLKPLLSEEQKQEFDRLNQQFEHTTTPEAKAQINTQFDALLGTLTEGDRRLAAMLVKRDAFNLAAALKPLTGSLFANYVFGFGVLAMAMSTITILMLISGFTICEILGLPPKGWPHRLGCLAPALGVLGPFIWSGKTQFWLAVPTSIFGMALLPIAYATFFLMMNNRSILGNKMPTGGRRVLWNFLMLVALALSTLGASWAVWGNEVARPYAVTAVGIFLVLAVIVHFGRPPKVLVEAEDQNPAAAG